MATASASIGGVGGQALEWQEPVQEQCCGNTSGCDETTLAIPITSTASFLTPTRISATAVREHTPCPVVHRGLYA